MSMGRGRIIISKFLASSLWHRHCSGGVRSASGETRNFGLPLCKIALKIALFQTGAAAVATVVFTLRE